MDIRGAQTCSWEVKFPGKDSVSNNKLGNRDQISNTGNWKNENQ